MSKACTCIPAGKFDIKPKKAALATKYKDDRELTKMINANNESTLASKAQQTGGHLSVVSSWEACRTAILSCNVASCLGNFPAIC